MRSQIKIILEYNEEGIDHDTTEPLTIASVFHNDKQIGMIHNLNVELDAGSFPSITNFEITFPDLENTITTMGWHASEELLKTLRENIKLLEAIPGVVIKLKPL